MSEGSARGLWAIAAAGSLLLHGSIGMALYAMPVPEPRKQSRTEIDIAALTAGAATQSAPAAKAAIADVHGEVAIVGPSDKASTAAEAAPVLAAAQPQPVELGSFSPLTTLQPVGSSDGPAIATHDILAPETAAMEEAIAPTPTGQVAPSQSSPEAAPVASGAVGQPVEVATVAAGEAQLETPPLAAPLSTTDQPMLAATVQMEPIASVSESTPSIALTEVAIAAAKKTRISTSLSPATPRPSPSAEPNSESAGRSHENIAAVPEAREDGTTLAAVSATLLPSALAASPQPVPSAAPGLAAEAPQPGTVVAASPVQSGTGAGGDEQAVPPVRPPAGRAQVAITPATSQPAKPIDDRASTGEKSTVVAALPQASVSVGLGSGAAKPNRLPITDFLAEREDGDCLLAIPTGTGPTAARIEAFAVEKSAVDRLGDEYQRLSGIPVKAETRPVSQDQCIALTFARSLPQYPNFLLRVSLAQPVIGSGQDLAGVISGLRKDTVYLVVVDDEGKAELADSYAGQRASVVNFSAPMTLTSGPVSSVQLLIAIASDGPLQTVPHRPGMPAEEFFSKLATEIVVGQRSIAFGMTSFVVK